MVKKDDKGRVDLHLGSELKILVEQKATSLGLKTNAYLRMIIIQALGGNENDK